MFLVYFKFFFIFFVLLNFPFVYSHGFHGPEGVSFENLFFLLSFGSIGIGLYSLHSEISGHELKLLEIGAAFFGGYYIISIFVSWLVGLFG